MLLTNRVDLVEANLAEADRRVESDADDGLLTSRCSYELVEKAVLAGGPMLATVSAPTELAVRRSGEAGLALRVFVRRDALLVLAP